MGEMLPVILRLAMVNIVLLGAIGLVIQGNPLRMGIILALSSVNILVFFVAALTMSNNIEGAVSAIIERVVPVAILMAGFTALVLVRMAFPAK